MFVGWPFFPRWFKCDILGLQMVKKKTRYFLPSHSISFCLCRWYWDTVCDCITVAAIDVAAIFTHFAVSGSNVAKRKSSMNSIQTVSGYTSFFLSFAITLPLKCTFYFAVDVTLLQHLIFFWMNQRWKKNWNYIDSHIIYDYDYSYAFLFINTLIFMPSRLFIYQEILKHIRHLQNTQTMNWLSHLDHHDQLPKAHRHK